MQPKQPGNQKEQLQSSQQCLVGQIINEPDYILGTKASLINSSLMARNMIQ